MNLLQVFFIISWVVILIVALDVARKQKFNALHFVIFIWIWAWLLTFTFLPSVLNKFWSLFWLQRWADLLVYSSIIFLIYFVLLLLSKVESSKDDMTKLVREIALFNSPKKILNWKYVFVIPAYNEWKVIYSTVSNVLKSWYENIIVVNDGSNDDTIQELEKLLDKVILLTHFKNRWQWAALETGFEYIRRYWNVDFIITFDSDGQHSLNDIKNFEDGIKYFPEAQVYLWSRFKWTVKNISLLKKIILKLWILFTFFISKIKLSDTHNWYRFIRKEALKDIKITMDWMDHASEIIDIIAQKNIPYCEIPVTIEYTDYSRSKWQSSLNAINIALRMIWSKFFR